MEGEDALDFDDEDNEEEFLDDEDNEEEDLPVGRESDDEEGELESDQDEDSYVRLLF